MITVRNDDVMQKSGSWPDPPGRPLYWGATGRFKQLHGWICRCPEHFIHVPSLMLYHVKDDPDTAGLLAFPEVIKFIEQETKEGRMQPEIHGVEHIDYKKVSYERCVADLQIMKDYIRKKFDYEATRWFTPWGANADHMHEAAKQEGLTLVDCSAIRKLPGRYGIWQRVKECKEPEHVMRVLNQADKSIFLHWYDGGARLLRVIETVKHGTAAEAAKHNKGLFD
jgi:hypothetical protein